MLKKHITPLSKGGQTTVHAGKGSQQAPMPQPQPEPQPQPQPVLQPQPQPQPTQEDWQHRYLSMEGRFKQSQTTVGSMQQQLADMGSELVRTQQILNARGAVQQEQPRTVKKMLTPEDEANFGPELIDFVKRAAQEAVSPELTAIEQQTRQDRDASMRAAKTAMYTQLVADVPDWRVINDNPRFISWLRLPDLYSGRIRQVLLNEAFQAANAPRVVAFFKGFVQDEQATGHIDPASQTQPQNPAPRDPAIPLVNLAAPGAAKPASGNTQVPAEKPIYSHAAISQFYTRVRQGYYAGREADKSREEADIFAAQREGRIR